MYPLEYLPAENVMIVKKKEHFYSLTETEHYLLPVLTIQVWVNDTFTPDDFIGEQLMHEACVLYILSNL